MKSKWMYNAFIIGFVILYIATAFISLCHAIEFFTIGNVHWMAITLASVFELGQMIVLSSLLLSDNKKTLVPWILLVVLTSVQVIGNVFSVYKYISLSGSDYYIYLQKSLIDWWLAGVSQDTIMVIISWIIGALLPIIALFMTSMVANNIQLRNEPESEHEEKASEDKASAVIVEEPAIEKSVSLEAPKKEVKEEVAQKVEVKEPESEKEVKVEVPSEEVKIENETTQPKQIYSRDTLMQ